MKIKLKQLTLINFKGAVNKTLNFADTSFIFGNNAAGKTTIFDAFTWLLFGKDSDGRTDFEIKTLDSHGNIIPQINHEVVGVLDIDGKETTFKRVLREKWVKKRGFEETSFEGNETLYFIDDVPKKKNEYQNYIDAIIDENLFKLITSPSNFNLIKWKDRRDLLMSIAGGINSDEIIASMDASEDQKQFVINMLASDKSLEDMKKTIQAKIKLEKDELKMIPTRIDEANRQMPEIPEGGFEEKRTDLKMQEHFLEKIDNQIQDKSKAVDDIVSKISSKKQDLYKVTSKITQYDNEAKAEAKRITSVDTSEFDQLKADKRELTNKIDELENDIVRSETNLTNLRKSIAELDTKQDAKRKEWSDVSSEEFDEKEAVCPTCGAGAFKNILELEKSFRETKKQRLDTINREGKYLQESKDNLFKRSDIETKKKNEAIAMKSSAESKLKLVTEKLKASTPSDEPAETEEKAYVRLVMENADIKTQTELQLLIEKDIEDLEKQMENPEIDKLRDKRGDINSEIDKLKAILLKESIINQVNSRIEDLKRQETTLAQSIASVERDLFLIDKYTKSSIDSLEKKINSMFEVVKFKMFEQQINGGESETCICTVDGVPYSDLNTAMKINAGLDIISTLLSHYKVSAPIFIDGRESVIDLINIDAQIINLVVSADDNELRVV